MPNRQSISQIDLILCKDPAGAYPLMELATRNCYCEVVKNIARQAEETELDVAQRAIDLAIRSQISRSNEECRAHVGYYLIDAGRGELEETVGYEPSWNERFSRLMRRNPTTLYLGLLVIFTVFILSLLDLYAFHMGVSPLMLAWLSLLFIIPASELALKVLEVIFKVKQTPLPKMDFSSGVPNDQLTMVVVPAIFQSEATVHELLETLESHYHANQDESIFFALLGDWSDAPEENMPQDNAILNAAIDGVRLLNARYHSGVHDRFYLFHRRRQWNQREGKWMGWERKRGKLHEFNKLLRGAQDTSYIFCAADQAFLAQIRYVITLDTSTSLPCNTARKLIGTIAHPLNRPEVNPLTDRVMRGYVIIQPWPDSLPMSAPRSRIPRILSNYISPDKNFEDTSNIYQDLFQEGLYLGKGLYDVDAFEIVLSDRFPENAVLSHDFIEGIYARTALATDIVVLEDRRLFYQSTAKRIHRWIRGDWQLLPWLMPYVRNARGALVRNFLPAIARWKILDPMRRSLFAPVMFLWFIAAWTALPGSSARWTLFILSFFAICNAFESSVIKRGKFFTKESVVEILFLIKITLFSIIVLANQAYACADAVVRALYRVFISRRRLLEWNPTAQVQKDSRHDLLSVFSFSRPAIMITLAVGIIIIISKPSSISLAAPFLLAWLISPLVIYWLTQVMEKGNIRFEQEAERSIRLTGRRIWRDIEQSINKQERQLSPDALQHGVNSNFAAHVMPASILRYPFWAVIAYDFGYIRALELADYLDRLLAKLSEYRKYNGKCHNHIDMRGSKLSLWRRVLSVENGNLAGHFTLYQQMCAETANRPLFDDNVLKGLSDTISLLKEDLSCIGGKKTTAKTTGFLQLIEAIDACANLISTQNQVKSLQTLGAWRSLFNSIARQASIIDERVNLLSQEDASINEELRYWASCLVDQERVFNHDLRMLAPWTFVPVTNLNNFIGDSGVTEFKEWIHIAEFIDRVPTISQLPDASRAILGELSELRSKICQRVHCAKIDHAALLKELDALAGAIEEASAFSKNLLLRYTRIARQSKEIMEMMDYRSLFDEERRILTDA